MGLVYVLYVEGNTTIIELITIMIIVVYFFSLSRPPRKGGAPSTLRPDSSHVPPSSEGDVPRYRIYRNEHGILEFDVVQEDD